MKNSLLFRSLRWMILATAIETAAATPSMGPIGAEETADFITVDVQADRRLVGCKIDVSVAKDIATLSGTVLSLEQADRAVARAKSTEGVRAVVNQLKIVDPVAKDAVLAERVQQRLSKSEALDASRVKVSVDKRRAVLRGQVGTWDEQELAREIATEIPGIKEIDNRLEVTFDTVRTDKAIKAQIQFMVADDPLFTGLPLDIRVKDGVVDLGGEIGSTSEKDQLVHRAHVTGVTAVKTDDLMISRAMAMEGMSGKVPSAKATLESLNAAFNADPRLKQADIRAEVVDKVVKLSGSVRDDATKAAAESTARGLPGVSIVSNEIQVLSGNDTASLDPANRVATITP